MTRIGDDGRPIWEPFENPALAGLPDLAKAQVVQAINCRLIAELVNAAGGTVTLPPGFNERVGTAEYLIGTRFLDDGSYLVWTEPLTPDYNHPGNATMWERMTGPRRNQAREVYGVAGYDEHDPYVTLRRVDPDTGDAMEDKPLLRVSEDHLRRGVGGWKRYAPPPEACEEFAGQPLS